MAGGLVAGLVACADGEALTASPDVGGGQHSADAAPLRDGRPALDWAGCAEGSTLPCGDLCLGLRHCIDGVLGPCLRPEERCNGLDDDCDGVIDEGFERLGLPCSAGVAACARDGIWRCSPEGEAVVCDARPAPGLPEACNGQDDDCDGAVDEGPEGAPLSVVCFEGSPDQIGVGRCQAGQRVCAAGLLGPCDGVGPAPETCDGVDEDCDGAVDEDFPGAGRPCAAGQGRCRVEGRIVCADGVERCDARPLPSEPERCNGEDDDCDGIVDELPGVGDACAAGQGICQRLGVIGCDPVAAALVCDAVADAPVEERCNGLDDDCDGTVDEGLGGEPCAAGVGACQAAGRWRCDPGAGRLVCDAQPGRPAVERCNGQDDDCDGVIDNVTDRDGICYAGVGDCRRAGHLRCPPEGPALVCDAVAGAPAEEICDGRDNDCDGRVDEGQQIPQGGEPCGVGRGLCRRPGTLACVEGAVRCDGVPGQPAAEICNGLDDDCDGIVDELPGTGLPCAAGVGACRQEARTACDPATGEIRCPALPGAPQPERCNGIDDDCDGVVDPAPVCAVFASCRAARDLGHRQDGIYRLQPGPGREVFEVWCDQRTDGGGWTLVGSVARRAFDDRRAEYSPDQMTLAPPPRASDAGIWHGLRALDSRFDVRFACRDRAREATAPFTVDLSMYDTPWYHEWTTAADADSCFSEGNGAGADPPPARRDNLTGEYLARLTPWATDGYLEGEDACGSTDDFTVDFNDRGMDSDESDGTDWGEDDGVLKCGRAGIADGQWFVFAREAGRYLRQGAFQVQDGPPWQNHRALSCQAACGQVFGPATWACSQRPQAPDRRAWLDGFGDGQSLCGPDSPGAPERFVAPREGGVYACGAVGCSYSAYVADHGCARENHCWRRLDPLAFVPPAVGSQGTAGRLGGDPWRICAADAGQAWVAADRAGTYAPDAQCQALGYTRADAWGGHCGRICGQCDPPAPRYDGIGGDATRLAGTVHWRCRR